MLYNVVTNFLNFEWFLARHIVMVMEHSSTELPTEIMNSAPLTLKYLANHIFLNLVLIQCQC